MTQEQLEQKVEKLEEKVDQLEGVLKQFLGDELMQEKKNEWIEKKNLEETCEFLRNLADELKDEKSKFPTRSFKNWISMMETSKNPEKYCKGITSMQKLNAQNLINIFEINQNMLIRRIRDFGPSAYEKLMRKLKEKV